MANPRGNRYRIHGSIRFDINQDDVGTISGVFVRLRSKASDMSPVTAEIAEFIGLMQRNSVYNGVDALGIPFIPLNYEYILYKGRYVPGRAILMWTGDMLGSQQIEFEPDSASAFFIDPKAAFHASLEEARNKIPLRDFISVDSDVVSGYAENLIDQYMEWTS